MQLRRYVRAVIMAAPLMVLLAGCATPVGNTSHPVSLFQADPVAVLNRITWGVSASTLQKATTIGLDRYLERQLAAEGAPLPSAVQARIAAMTISQRPLQRVVQDMERQRRDSDLLADAEQKKSAREAYQREMNRLAREAADRMLLRALYSPNQLLEQMTWFWSNHFSLHQAKRDLRAMVGDYEEQAIRPHALGKFRDLLMATVQHPAMLRYLDNEQNAAGRLNENYARELMELHTLGVEGGYSQRDVQELARILTGVGINRGDETPKVRKELQTQYVRRGLFEFNPNRHDYGDKQFLGAMVKGRGLAEVDEAIDRLSRAPATARFVSRKLAVYFVQDVPPPELIEQMAHVFLRSDGNIADTLGVLFSSPAFAASLGHKFKDPVHFVLAAVRLAYDDQPIRSPGPMVSWLNRLGEPLFGRQTPDGYPLSGSAWDSPGQMTVRFEIAKAIGSTGAGLFKTDESSPQEPAFPQLSNALYFQSLKKRLSPRTRQVLAQAASPQEWNTLLLSSPEMMQH